jgi:hypothetical protein
MSSSGRWIVWKWQYYQAGEFIDGHGLVKLVKSEDRVDIEKYLDLPEKVYIARPETTEDWIVCRVKNNKQYETHLILPEPAHEVPGYELKLEGYLFHKKQDADNFAKSSIASGYVIEFKGTLSEAKEQFVKDPNEVWKWRPLQNRPKHLRHNHFWTPFVKKFGPTSFYVKYAKPAKGWLRAIVQQNIIKRLPDIIYEEDRNRREFNAQMHLLAMKEERLNMYKFVTEATAKELEDYFREKDEEWKQQQLDMMTDNSDKFKRKVKIQWKNTKDPWEGIRY